ncbi:MAG: hypothetical protein AAB819_02710 [Patescibacteria group bacterium]
MEIIPTIIPKSLDDLREKLSFVRGAAPVVQIDITDGAFAGKKSWPLNDDAAFQRMISEAEGLPFWEDFIFEVDFMITHTEERAEDFFRAGFSRAVFHFGAADDMHKALSLARQYDVDAGIALLPSEDPEILKEYEGEFQFVQVMGIGRIGFQGERYDERALHTVSRVREIFPDIIISVDGGISERTATLFRDAGADRLVAGSAIFHTDDPREAFLRLSSITATD